MHSHLSMHIWSILVLLKDAHSKGEHMSTQVKFAPFGIGIHSMDSDEAKQAIHTATEKGKNTCFFLLGVVVLSGEIILRSTANGLNKASEAVADVHTAYVKGVANNNTLHKAANSVTKS